MSDYKGRHREPWHWSRRNTAFCTGLFSSLTLGLLMMGGLQSNRPPFQQSEAYPSGQASEVVIPALPTPVPTPQPSPAPAKTAVKPSKSVTPTPNVPVPQNSSATATVSVIPSPTPSPIPPSPVSQAPLSGTTMMVFLTGYSYWDNDPPGSAAISDPVIHQTAGGTGTYDDPVTLAVGYTSTGPDIAPGTKFYIPAIHRYVIVEDTCGACHKGHGGHVWIDVYVDGSGTSSEKAEDCMDEFTGNVTVIKSPEPGLAVTQGPISSSVGCLF